MPVKYFTVEGVATFVHHRGPTTLPGHPPDTSKGSVVLCLHDAGGNGAELSGVLDALAEASSPLAYDQPGHGRSGALDSLGDVSAMARHLRLLADQLGLRSPVLLGEGLGAAVAIEAALGDPTWPRALVLCGGAGLTLPFPDAALAELRRIAGGKARREFDRSGYAPDTPREVYQKAFAEWVKTDPRVTLGDRTAQQAWSARGRTGVLTCPVVVVVGEHEDDAARAAAKELADSIGGGKGQVVSLSGAGRHGVLEQPAGLASITLEAIAAGVTP